MNAAARLAGVEARRFEVSETTITQRYDRPDRAIEYPGTFTPEQFVGSEVRPISVPRRDKEPPSLDGRRYPLGFVTPNLYFHVAIASALLRHAGVPLRKAEFPGGC